MIVDDEPFNLFALESLLRMQGVRHIEQAFNGRVALEALRRRDYDVDVVLTDFQMPLMNGVELASAVRALQAEGTAREGLAVVLLSGNIFTQSFPSVNINGRDRSLFDLTLLKPFTQELLVNMLTDLQALSNAYK